MISESENKVVIESKKRDSNLELFRIITMILIIAHHYVVNSGLTDADGPLVQNQFCLKSLFYLIFGAWGKTGINCFVLITGYFMCKSKITLKKFLKLVLEVYFYKIIIYLIFLFSGYEPFSLKILVKTILPFTSLDKGFTGCYLMFYLCIPFLNVLVQNLTEKQHRYLLILLLAIYTLFGSVPFFTVTFNYITWFCVLYIIASYIRLHSIPLFDNTKFWLLMTILSMFISISSVVAFAWIGDKLGKFIPFFFVADSNKILAVTTGISSFMLFKNLKIKYNPFINKVASTTFGVLLIHANCETMRRWLWKDLLHNVQMYDSPYFALHAIGSVLGIFIFCAIIDYVRIVLVENRFINHIA